MFDLGWSEMLVILVVALIVIGPKDLPKVARQIGRWTAKARAMAREFQRSFDEMAREAELEELKSSLQKVNPHHLSQTIRETIDPKGELDRLGRELDIREDLERVDRPSPVASPPAGAQPSPENPRAESGGTEAALATATPAAPAAEKIQERS
ncbi:MAG: Sec-independent protein translocase protein TatB [Geminicoccaceae bacterium]|nr:Sec-independent protein translocase protein TatB [Geminicoccaceae bacterium]MCS7268396.1 Sec-independent protein translocase protein TatB [Geminicoccaceae bacterium]MDW8124289.1 Sec-independent protein translocase protein TatB [Geminicoccaceae bacterium]MDW8342198.1 Sec-independent protein translocase protein TatB [Geminicoccaceae bacterium]